MVNKTQKEALQKLIDSILSHNKPDLYCRGEWGEINFEAARDDLSLIFDLLSQWRSLPFEKLPGGAYQKLQSPLAAIAEKIRLIEGFHITSQSNPREAAAQYIRNIHDELENMLTESAQWIA